MEGLLEWPRVAEGRGDRVWFRVPEHYLLQISISTMSDKSWTLDVATESSEAVLWPPLYPRRLSGSSPRQAAALSGGPSVWVLPSLLPCLA